MLKHIVSLDIVLLLSPMHYCMRTCTFLKDVIIFCGFHSQLVICKIFVLEFSLTKFGLLQMENRINVNNCVWRLQGKMASSSLPAATVEVFFNVVTTLLACSGLLTLFNSFPTTKIADCDISEGNFNALNIYIYIAWSNVQWSYPCNVCKPCTIKNAQQNPRNIWWTGWSSTYIKSQEYWINTLDWWHPWNFQSSKICTYMVCCKTLIMIKRVLN